MVTSAGWTNPVYRREEYEDIDGEWIPVNEIMEMESKQMIPKL